MLICLKPNCFDIFMLILSWPIVMYLFDSNFGKRFDSSEVMFSVNMLIKGRLSAYCILNS